MTETTDQRIERVARAIWNTDPGAGRSWPYVGDVRKGQYIAQARAADAISFQAGWDAAVAVLTKRHREATIADQGTWTAFSLAAEYLIAHRPGEAP